MELRGLLRLPSFRAALLGSLATLGAVIAYILVTPSSPRPWFVGIYNTPEPFVLLWDGSSANQHRPRLVFEAVIALATVGLGVIVAYRLFRGSPRGRSLRAWLLAIAVAAMWITVIKERAAILTTANGFRVRQAMPKIKNDAEVLLHGRSGRSPIELPFCGQFWWSLDNPDGPYLVGTSWQGPVWQIKDTPDSGLRFYLCYPCWTLEYRPNGRPPVFEDLLGVGKSTDCSELEPNWFLVTYTVVPMPR